MTTKKEDPFFIGWRDENPVDKKKSNRKFVIIVSLLIVFIPALFVLMQNQFGLGNFQFGNLVTLEGQLIQSPELMLHVSQKTATEYQLPSQNLLLFGFGKFGAFSLFKEFLDETNEHVIHLSIQGTLIIEPSKAGLEVTNGRSGIKPIETKIQSSAPPFDIPKSKSKTLVQGEIIDSKCALGVMKPGFGKVHRSCAIRCISGGIPPLFREQITDGRYRYYLIKSQKETSISLDLIPYIGDQIALCGIHSSWDDWDVLWINTAHDIIANPNDLDGINCE